MNPEATMVRMTDEDGTSHECTLDEFLASNPEIFDFGEEERFAAGEAILIGGGACPPVRVQLVSTIS